MLTLDGSEEGKYQHFNSNIVTGDFKFRSIVVVINEDSTFSVF